MRNKLIFSLLLLLLVGATRSLAIGVGGSGMYQWSVELSGYVSAETGKAPNAYLWIPEGCKKVRAVILAQQNMTEETIYRMPAFQKQMKDLDVGMIWVAPAFSNNWNPASNCQTIFEHMMTGLAGQSGHAELEKAPVIPLGHSAQATFPWNFAAWNPMRTLCIISFHGDAPRTNLCGYGTDNVEWGRTRNIDGIPGLMVEGEYEWWEARVNPALAFRMMYPKSCISFLCDTGRGHFDCGEQTAKYIGKFIQKAFEKRWTADGTLRQVDPQDGWLADRYHPDIPGTDGDDKGKVFLPQTNRPAAAPYHLYKGDKHDAFWYFDKEMAELTEERYAETRGKKLQYVGFEYQGALVPYSEKVQGGMSIVFQPIDDDGLTIRLKPVYTDEPHQHLSSQHGKGKLHIEVISGPIEKIDDYTFRIRPYEAGWDNPRRAFSCRVVAVADADKQYKGAVQPLQIKLPQDIVARMLNLQKQ